MIVLLDAGNSRFKWCGLHDGALTKVFSSEYAAQERTRAMLTALESAKPRRMVIASVLGDEFRQEFTRLISTRYGFDPEFVVTTRQDYGVEVAYDSPQSLGPDRFCALVAARRRFSAPCIVVDCGTAVTIDALGEDGRHLGGLIFPGLTLMRRSLIEHTARITINSQNHDIDAPLFGRSTAQGVNAGTLRALAGGIDRIVGDMTAHISRLYGMISVRHVMTGGAADFLCPHLTAEYDLAPGLILEGLAIIADTQRKSVPG